MNERPEGGGTRRQTQILERLAAGLQDKEIAADLKISRATVRTHLYRLFRRYGVASRTALVARWISRKRR